MGSLASDNLVTANLASGNLRTPSLTFGHPEMVSPASDNLVRQSLAFVNLVALSSSCLAPVIQVTGILINGAVQSYSLQKWKMKSGIFVMRALAVGNWGTVVLEDLHLMPLTWTMSGAAAIGKGVQLGILLSPVPDVAILLNGMLAARTPASGNLGAVFLPFEDLVPRVVTYGYLPMLDLASHGRHTARLQMRHQGPDSGIALCQGLVTGDLMTVNPETGNPTSADLETEAHYLAFEALATPRLPTLSAHTTLQIPGSP